MMDKPRCNEKAFISEAWRVFAGKLSRVLSVSMNRFAAISQDISQKLQTEFIVNPLHAAPARSAMVH